MPRPKLSNETKECRLNLRVLALWRLDNREPVERGVLLAGLANSVDVGWGRKGRPSDLGTPQEEAEATIAHLVQNGYCEAAGEPGHETVRLVRPAVALEQAVGRLRKSEEKARRKADDRLRDGNWLPVSELWPSSWKSPLIKRIGKRYWHAVEQAVLQRMESDPAYEVRTVDKESGQAVEEVRLAPADKTVPLADGDATSGGAVSEGAAKPVVDPGGGPGEHGEQVPALEKMEIVMLPVSQLRPNPWNPNVMTPEQEAEQLAEIRRNGGPAKPIVVRPMGEAVYQILDGEHSWRNSEKAGLTEVPCMVLQVDDFEAMRLTYVANLQGKRDPVRTGRLFQKMLELRGMSLDTQETSLRQFALENNISEGTLRNYLLYAKAAEVRNGYAPETADATIGELSVVKVREYLKLPNNRRDEWLDRGASSAEAAAILEKAGKKSKEAKQAVETVMPTPGPRTSQPCNSPSGEPEEVEEQAGVDGDDDQSSPAPAVQEEGKPEEPLSQAEQEVVTGALKSYREGRELVRHKILAGLAACPDAVAFFRRMIKAGS